MNSNLIPMRFSSKYTAIRISLGAALIAAAAQAQTVPAARTHTWWHDTGAGLRPYTANAKKLPLISVKGNKFVDPQGATVLFRGLSISDPDKLEMQGHWNREHFVKVAEMGTHVVRIPVHPIAWRERTPAEYLKLLDQAVEWSTDLGMYVDLDWHSIGNLTTGVFQDPMYDTSLQETYEFWRIMARHFAGPPPGYKPLLDATTALSPDGSQVAFGAADAKGKQSLWVRALDSLTPKRLEGSESLEDYYSFTWTPDGRAIVAAIDGKLVRLSATGGANEMLCEGFHAYPITMNRDGTILAWTAPPTSITSVSPDDCTPRDRSPSRTSQSDVKYAYPHFLPDGKHFLFAAIRKDKHHDVLLGALDDPKVRVLIRNGSYPKYVSSGYIFFSRDGYLMAQRFNAKSFTSSGEPFLVYPNHLRFYAAFGWAAFDASRNGAITAQEETSSPTLLRWYARSGQVLKTLGDAEYAIAPRLDAQEAHALVFLFNPRTHMGDIWSLDLEHGTRRRESFQERPVEGSTAWTAHGERIVYSVLLGTHDEIFIKNAGSSDNGRSEERRVGK